MRATRTLRPCQYDRERFRERLRIIIAQNEARNRYATRTTRPVLVSWSRISLFTFDLTWRVARSWKLRGWRLKGSIMLSVSASRPISGHSAVENCRSWSCAERESRSGDHMLTTIIITTTNLMLRAITIISRMGIATRHTDMRIRIRIANLL